LPYIHLINCYNYFFQISKVKLIHNLGLSNSTSKYIHNKI
jgi:hypothetical protein